MTFEPGQRVRCVNNDYRWTSHLVVGGEYKVLEGGECYLKLEDGKLYFKERFKPIVRVKMGRAAC